MIRQGVKFKKMVTPYFFMLLTWTPLFLIIFFVPDNIDGTHYLIIDKFIDSHMISNAGTWSSNFPFTSKLIINYICFFAPVFAIIFCYLTLNRSTLEILSFDNISRFKAFFYVAGLTTIILLVIYLLYIDSTDLANSRKLAVFGRYKLLYAIYSSGLMYIYYIVFLSSYFIYGFLPKAIIKPQR